MFSLVKKVLFFVFLLQVSGVQADSVSHERIMMSLANQQIQVLETYLNSTNKVTVTDTTTFKGTISYIPTKVELENALISANLMKEADNLVFDDEYDLSIPKYNESIKYNPYDPFLVMTLGNAYLFKKDKVTALKYFKNAIKMAPKDYIQMNILKAKLSYCN